MKAKINVTYKDNTVASFTDGDFFTFQFNNDLEDKNNAYIKIGDNYVKKSEIRSCTYEIEGETK